MAGGSSKSLPKHQGDLPPFRVPDVILGTLPLRNPSPTTLTPLGGWAPSGCKWLMTMVIVSPLNEVVGPLINGRTSWLIKWGLQDPNYLLSGSPSSKNTPYLRRTNQRHGVSLEASSIDQQRPTSMGHRCQRLEGVDETPQAMANPRHGREFNGVESAAFFPQKNAKSR